MKPIYTCTTYRCVEHEAVEQLEEGCVVGLTDCGVRGDARRTWRDGAGTGVTYTVRIYKTGLEALPLLIEDGFDAASAVRKLTEYVRDEAARLNGREV